MKKTRVIKRKSKLVRKRSPVDSQVQKLKAELIDTQRQLMKLERQRFDHLKQRSGDDDSPELLAAGVAHEFNNILGALEGHATWALEEDSLQGYREAIAMVQLACRRSHQITRSLQHFAQPREEEVTRFQVSDLRDELVRSFEAECRLRGVHLSVKLDPASVRMSRSALLEVLFNLIHNSLDAFAAVSLSSAKAGQSLDRPGGVWLIDQTISLSGKISKAGRGQARYVISMRDSASGIPEVLQSRIFQPFFTTKGVLSEVEKHKAIFRSALPESSQSGGGPSEGSAPAKIQGGGGLGLFLCRRLVREAGGRITLVKSQPGHTEFEILLPII